MNAKNALLLLVVGLMAVSPPVVRGDAQAQEPPKVQIPQPGVPQIMTMEGKFVRATYNNEGYVIIGYQLVNRSVGQDWMLLEVGVTVLDNPPAYDLKLTFFSDLTSRVLSVDEIELSRERACLGRLFFKVPGGITYGQHWLNVKFEKSLVRVPFKVLTKEEEKLLGKNYKSISKQVKEAFKPPKKK